jgi:hypothetical protein
VGRGRAVGIFGFPRFLPLGKTVWIARIPAGGTLVGVKFVTRRPADETEHEAAAQREVDIRAGTSRQERPRRSGTVDEVAAP